MGRKIALGPRIYISVLAWSSDKEARKGLVMKTRHEKFECV